MDKFIEAIKLYFDENIKTLYDTPLKMIALIVDILIVGFLLYTVFKKTRNTRVWQLLKGILLLIVVTFLSGIFNLSTLRLSKEYDINLFKP